MCLDNKSLDSVIFHTYNASYPQIAEWWTCDSLWRTIRLQYYGENEGAKRVWEGEGETPKPMDLHCQIITNNNNNFYKEKAVSIG